MTNAKHEQKIPVIAPSELQDPFGQHDVLIVERCTKCSKPTHASESNDDGVCVECLGDEAITPSDDDERDAPEIIDEMMYVIEGGDCSPGGKELTFEESVCVFDHVVALFNSGAMMCQLTDNANDGGRAFETMRDTLDRFADTVFQLSANRDERRKADKCREALHAIGDVIKAHETARKLTVRK